MITITNTTIQIITENFFRLRKKYSEVFLTHTYYINTFQKLQKFLFFVKNIMLKILYLFISNELDI